MNISMKQSILSKLVAHPTQLAAYVVNELQVSAARLHMRRRRMVIAISALVLALLFVSAPHAETSRMSMPTEKQAAPPIALYTLALPEQWDISPQERDLVIQAVVGTAGNYSGQLAQMAVAQCIRNACVVNGEPVETVLRDYRYNLSGDNPGDGVIEAVDAVIRGAVINTEILYSSPNGADSTNRFYAERTAVASYGDLTFYR